MYYNKLNSQRLLHEFILEAENKFNSEYAESRRYEAELIISHVLKINRIDIYTKTDLVISHTQKELINSYFERRKLNEPIQYILGEEYFRELTLSVGPGVLIPRPETEELVEKALQLLNTNECTMLDVGTGSGAIALSLAHERSNSYVIGVDISNKALKYASINKKNNNIINVSFIKSNLCSCFGNNSFGLITANLPYVTENEYLTLDDDVKEFEPKLALTGGDDGLDLVRKLIPQAYEALKNNGWILLEIGYMQGLATKKLLEYNYFTNTEIIKDFCDKDRIVIGQKIER